MSDGGSSSADEVPSRKAKAKVSSSTAEIPDSTAMPFSWRNCQSKVPVTIAAPAQLKLNLDRT